MTNRTEKVELKNRDPAFKPVKNVNEYYHVIQDGLTNDSNLRWTLKLRGDPLIKKEDYNQTRSVAPDPPPVFFKSIKTQQSKRISLGSVKYKGNFNEVSSFTDRWLT